MPQVSFNTAGQGPKGSCTGTADSGEGGEAGAAGGSGVGSGVIDDTDSGGGGYALKGDVCCNCIVFIFEYAINHANGGVWG